MHNIIEKPLHIQCDLSQVNLSDAILMFRREFDFLPEWVNVRVPIESIFYGVLMQGMLYPCTVHFKCDRDLSPNSWNVTAYYKDTEYTIYSKGA